MDGLRGSIPHQERRRPRFTVGETDLPAFDIERTVLDPGAAAGRSRRAAREKDPGWPVQNNLTVNPVCESIPGPVFPEGMDMAVDDEEAPDGLPAGIAEEFHAVPPDHRFRIRGVIGIEMAAGRPVHVGVGTDFEFRPRIQCQDPFLAGKKDKAAGGGAVGRIPLPVIGSGEFDGREPDRRPGTGRPAARPVRAVEGPARLPERVVQAERMAGGEKAAEKQAGAEAPQEREKHPHLFFAEN